MNKDLFTANAITNWLIGGILGLEILALILLPVPLVLLGTIGFVLIAAFIGQVTAKRNDQCSSGWSRIVRGSTEN
ncbi:MAG: hypothetical protein WC714_19945 [Candidatus Obscuribacterales bacterium]|jgi:hypothetical protein